MVKPYKVLRWLACCCWIHRKQSESTRRERETKALLSSVFLFSKKGKEEERSGKEEERSGKEEERSAWAHDSRQVCLTMRKNIINFLGLRTP